MRLASLTTSRSRVLVITVAVLVVISAPAFAQTTMRVVGDDVGIGTDTPAEKLHVKDGDLLIEQTGVGVGATLNFDTAACDWDIFQNGNTGRLNFFTTCEGATNPSFKLDAQAQANLLRVGVVASNRVDINGDLVITGDCTEQNGACADYVFEPDYELRSLDELGTFIAANKHLPNVPSAEKMSQDGVNMTRLAGRLLEKIEELTLYTLQQQEQIEELQTNLEEILAEKQ